MWFGIRKDPGPGNLFLRVREGRLGKTGTLSVIFP
jgi:hypothetical protein